VAADKTGNQKNMQAAQAQLAGAEATVAADKTGNQKNLQSAQAQLAGAEATVAADKTGNQKNIQQAEETLQSELDSATSDKTSRQQSLQSAQDQLAGAEATVTADKTSNQKNLESAQADVNAARTTLSQDESQLSEDVADAAVGTTGGSGSPTYTYLAQVGQVIGRGQELFAIDGQPSILLFGNVTPWRAFMPGMSPGTDVSALNANLDALGYGHDLRGDKFTGATEAAVRKFQVAHHMTPTGQLALGSVLFEPGQIEVNSVTPTIGSTPSAGQAVFQVTLTARQVQIPLDASQQSDVAVGDQVSIVMPNNSTTPGVVSYVGTVATTPSGGSSPTIEVNVTPLDPAATGNLDDLPVNVWITQATVPNALVVQVQALVALSGGGYALEVAPAHGHHYLEAVTVGQFDDADGMVQVSGAGVQVGQRVVIPNV
jgi:Putative peptidoglycan binding domain